MSYQLVKQLHKKVVPALQLCRVLSEPLGLPRLSPAHQARAQGLASTHLKAEFAARGKVYGSRRLSAVLRAQGLCVGHHRVRRLVWENKLPALWRRKFIHTAYRNGA